LEQGRLQIIIARRLLKKVLAKPKLGEGKRFRNSYVSPEAEQSSLRGKLGGIAACRAAISRDFVQNEF